MRVILQAEIYMFYSVYHHRFQYIRIESLVTMRSPNGRRDIEPASYFTLSKTMNKLGNVMDPLFIPVGCHIFNHLKMKQKSGDQGGDECSRTTEPRLVHSCQCGICLTKRSKRGQGFDRIWKVLCFKL